MEDFITEINVVADKFQLLLKPLDKKNEKYESTMLHILFSRMHLYTLLSIYKLENYIRHARTYKCYIINAALGVA